MKTRLRRCCHASERFMNDDPFMNKKKKQTYLWSTLGLLGFLVVWFCLPLLIDLRDPVQFVLPENEDLELPPSIHVTKEKLQDMYWKDQMSYVVSTMKKACDTYHYISITNHNIEIDGKRLKDSIVYMCNTHRGYINLQIKDAGPRDIRCTERYASRTMSPIRASKITAGAVDVETFQKVSFDIDDPQYSCRLQQAHDIMMSSWSI